MSITNNLKIIFDRKGYKTVQQMADYSGFNTEYLRQVLHGKKIPSDDMILDACVKMRLSEEQTKNLLIAAATDRAKKPETKKVIKRVLNTNFSNTETNKDNIIEVNTDFYKAPVYASIQAGQGNLLDKAGEIVDEVLLTKEEYNAKCFAIKISGDSMEPDIRNGDIGIFEPPNGLQPAEDDIVAVELESYPQWMVKLLKITTPGNLKLVSINKKFEPISVNTKVEGVQIRGILLRTVRKFKKRLFL